MTKLALEFPGGKIIEESISGLDPTRFGITDISKLTSADIINAIIPVVFILAGIILLFILVFGGFTIFVSAGNPEKIKKGTGMITSALIGFLIIFAAYWIIELLQITFGIQVL